MHEKSLQHLQNEMDDCELDLNSTCSYSVYTLKLHTQTCTTIRINNTKQCFRKDTCISIKVFWECLTAAQTCSLESVGTCDIM